MAAKPINNSAGNTNENRQETRTLQLGDDVNSNIPVPTYEDMFSREAAVSTPVRARGIVEATAADNWMRTDKATHTKDGAASSQPVGGGETHG
ncbi:hypothetical protein AMECASPLE_001905 [Ameca splendens]|uniref:Uncharacterized protein n=1 Tax=Ameca splendens TaxID=208324 RepID=A0ABV0YK82_9TELE